MIFFQKKYYVTIKVREEGMNKDFRIGSMGAVTFAGIIKMVTGKCADEGDSDQYKAKLHTVDRNRYARTR